MSENIFTELYNRVLSLFGQTSTKEESKDVACNRLRVVLMQDRTNLTPELLQRMRKELVELLSKYVEMDKEALELNFEQDGEQMALMLSIPVVRAKEEDEIQAALDEAEKSEDDASEDESDDEFEDEESENNSDDEKTEDNEEEKSEDNDECSKDENSEKEEVSEDNEKETTDEESVESEETSLTSRKASPKKKKTVEEEKSEEQPEE